MFSRGTQTLSILTMIITGLMMSGGASFEAKAGQAEDPELIVVAPQAFASTLKEFIEFKGKRLRTEIVILEEVLTAAESAGDHDDAARLKQYLYTRWVQSGGNLAYVLLVGDADVLPVRYMVLDRKTEAAFDYAFYPSDLYYGDVAKADGSFDDWNGMKEGFHADYFGEVRGEANKQDAINFDAIDYRPELAIGRWPVSSAVEVNLVAEKTMTYERGMAARRAENENPLRAGFIASGGWIENRSMMDGLVGSLADGWERKRLYFADETRDDKTAEPNEAEVLGLLNEGCDLVFHSGHGTGDSWHGAISTKSLTEVTNAERLPIIFSAGCSTARFATLPPYEAYLDADGMEHAGTNHGEVFTAPPPPPAVYQRDEFNPSGLGEQLLKNSKSGAVAYLGCNTGSQPCGMTLMRGFVTGLSDRHRQREGARPIRLGDCWRDAVSYYYEAEQLATLRSTASWYPASVFFQAMKFMVFGDPSIPMTSDEDPVVRPAAALGPGYVLVWQDEFEGVVLDETKWNHSRLGPRRDAINVREAVALDGNGHLKITTSKHRKSDGSGKDEFHTAMLDTHGTFDPKFGYFEARMRLQREVGHWSAFWLHTPTMGKELGNTATSGTEIDVIEYLRNGDNSTIAHHNLHWDGYGKDHKSHGRKVQIANLGDGEFHTFGLLWTTTEYVFYVDGRETWRTTKAISQRPQYMILSCEVGTWAGSISKAILPDALVVDYVRVFQVNAEGASVPSDE